MSLRRLAGFPTHVVPLSRGGPPTLFIHCALANAGAWTGVAAALGPDPGRALTAFDLPGHGHSADWTADQPLPDLCNAVAAALAAEIAPGAADRLDLVGHSFGAVVALRLALERPERIRSLALIDPVFFAAADPAASLAQRTADAALAALLAAGRREEAARGFLSRWGSGWEALPPARRARAAARIHLIPASAPALWDDAPGLLAPGRLETFDRPVLILTGGDSPPVMAAIRDGLAARLPRADPLTLPEAGHMLPVTHPAETAGALRRLWSRAD